MCCYLSVSWYTRSHTGVTQDRGFANRTCWLGWTHTRGCLMSQAAKDGEKGHKHSCISIQSEACSTFRNFLSWEQASCCSLPSETPAKIPVSMGEIMLGQWAVMEKFPADLWRRSFWFWTEGFCWMSAHRSTRLLQPALYSIPFTGAQWGSRIRPENIS